MADQGVREGGDGVAVRHNVAGDAVPGRRFGRDRADAGDHHTAQKTPPSLPTRSRKCFTVEELVNVTA